MPPIQAFARLSGRIDGVVRHNEPLSRHTTYRIGGPASLYVECDTVGALAHTLDVLAEESVPWTVLGKGSNVLASDQGYDGAILVLGRDFRRHDIAGDTMSAGAGCVLAGLVQDAFKHGLAGLEFAVGIPGTLGGALAMNAGTRDEWIGGIVESVTLYAPGQGLVALRGSEVAWGYRKTDLPSRGVIVEASLRACPGDTTDIRRRMEAALRRRKKSQPLSKPNAGSVFVNPEGDSAGRLIEAAGLKGARIGGAVVSDLHANFIVNDGGATAADVIALIARVREEVYDLHGIELRPEVRFLGSFDPA